jgi:hypothetical protein
MDLFLDNLPELEKEFRKESGYVSRLSEKAESWPQELANDLHKQLPYLSDYEVNINLDKVEAQRGYAFGFADVSNKTERPEVEHEEAGLPHIRIPIVIEERAVKPFSVYLDGERVLPLTEERVREVLFNPSTFDISTQGPRDPSLVEPLMPPNRTGIGMGGEYKTASVSLLRSIATTIRESDAERFIKKIASDKTLAAGLQRSGIGPTLIEVFDNTKRASAEERLQIIADNIAPTVITMQKLPGGDFLVKSASANAFTGDKKAKGEVVPKEEAEQAMGPENAQAMQPGQTATATADPVQPQQAPTSKAKIIEEFGQYNVQDTMGNTLMGWVFPTTLSWDGSFSPEPMALFTNGSSYALQDAVAGEIVGKSTVLPSDEPRGDGVFYTVQGGDAICTVPITVGSAMAGPDGLPRFVGTDAFGNQVQIGQMDGINNPERISDVEYMFPSSWKFMRLNNQTQLVSDPSQFFKLASIRAEKNSVTLFYNGSYNLNGGCGLDKLAREFKVDLDTVSAEFMLGLLGLDGQLAKSKVAESRRKGSVKIAGLKTITLLGEHYKQAVKTASALVSKIPDLRKDLLKEAASLEDEATVDNILALNFINPENLATFVSYLPELEKTSENLAEMLLSSYLGMQELPEGALERTMKALEEVIVGLKSMEHANA